MMDCIALPEINGPLDVFIFFGRIYGVVILSVLAVMYSALAMLVLHELFAGTPLVADTMVGRAIAWSMAMPSLVALAAIASFVVDLASPEDSNRLAGLFVAFGWIGLLTFVTEVLLGWGLLV
jgi:hypothetical protein